MYLIILLAIMFAFENLAKKHVLTKLKPMELLTGISFVNLINITLLLVISGKFFPVVSELKRKFTFPLLFALILFSCMIIVGAYTLSYLALKEEISEIIPLMAIFSTILTFFGGIFFFKEKTSSKDYVALLFMMGGIFLMAY